MLPRRPESKIESSDRVVVRQLFSVDLSDPTPLRLYRLTFSRPVFNPEQQAKEQSVSLASVLGKRKLDATAGKKKKTKAKRKKRASKSDGNRMVMDQFAQPEERKYDLDDEMEIDNGDPAEEQRKQKRKRRTAEEEEKKSRLPKQKSSYISKLLDSSGKVPDGTYAFASRVHKSRIAVSSSQNTIGSVPKSLHFFVQHVVDRDDFMWLFGVNKAGHSIACRTSFNPWFYVKLPDTWQSSDTSNLQSLMGTMDPDCVFKWQSVKDVLKSDLIGFTNRRKDRYLKIFLNNTTSWKNAQQWFRNKYWYYNPKTRKNEKLEVTW